MLTHQHMDHLGLLEILVRRSGAEVAAFHELTGYLANFSASAAADDEFAQAIMRRHGVPEDLADRARLGRLRLQGVRLERPGDATACTTATRWRCATAGFASFTAPATAPRTRSSSTRSGGC